MLAPNIIAGYAELELNLRSLARELVQNIQDATTILKKYGVDQAEYDRLAESAMFQGMLREAQKEWEAASNTKDRVRLKSAVAYEQSIADLYGQVNNRNEPLSSRVAVATLFAKTAGLLNPEPVVNKTPDGFRLEINFAGAAPTPHIVIDHQPVTVESNPEDDDWGEVEAVALPEAEVDPFDEAFAETYAESFKASRGVAA